MKITGEYWIIEGRADFADSNNSDKSHELIAVDHICSQNIEKVYNYAKKLNLGKIPSLSSLEDEPKQSVQSLLELILKKLFQKADPQDQTRPLYKNDVQIWNVIERECGFDKETLKIMMENHHSLYRYSKNTTDIDPRLYVMKREGWIAVRNNNVELYGIDQSKAKELASGLDDIIDQESNWSGVEEEEFSDENIEFNLFDHKTGKSIDITLKDIKEGNLFRPQRLPQTTYNTILPTIQGKHQGRELWRGTSESSCFKKWLTIIELKK